MYQILYLRLIKVIISTVFYDYYYNNYHNDLACALEKMMMSVNFYLA